MKGKIIFKDNIFAMGTDPRRFFLEKSGKPKELTDLNQKRTRYF
jgi:hypothetical protein